MFLAQQPLLSTPTSCPGDHHFFTSFYSADSDSTPKSRCGLIKTDVFYVGHDSRTQNYRLIGGTKSFFAQQPLLSTPTPCVGDSFTGLYFSDSHCTPKSGCGLIEIDVFYIGHDSRTQKYRLIGGTKSVFAQQPLFLTLTLCLGDHHFSPVFILPTRILPPKSRCSLIKTDIFNVVLDSRTQK